MTEPGPGPGTSADSRPPLSPVGHIAQRHQWPEGAAEACRAIEAEFPECSAYYAAPITLSYGNPGYRAWLPGRRYAKRPLRADTPEALREQIRALLDGGSDETSN